MTNQLFSIIIYIVMGSIVLFIVGTIVVDELQNRKK
jgi:uncharacterized membrane protein SirB2